MTYPQDAEKVFIQSKKKANSHYINKNDNKCKATWTVIKNEIWNTNSKDNIELRKLQNKTLTDPKKIATAFNDYNLNLTHQSINEYHHNDSNVTASAIYSMFLKPMSKTEA